MTHVIWPPVWWAFNDDEGASGIDDVDEGDEDIVVDNCVADDDEVISVCVFDDDDVVVVVVAVVDSKQFGLIF